MLGGCWVTYEKNGYSHYMTCVTPSGKQVGQIWTCLGPLLFYPEYTVNITASILGKNDNNYLNRAVVKYTFNNLM